jgi:hypothetical protein
MGGFQMGLRVDFCSSDCPCGRVFIRIYTAGVDTLRGFSRGIASRLAEMFMAEMFMA